jgi:hypothetical protein
MEVVDRFRSHEGGVEMDMRIYQSRHNQQPSRVEDIVEGRRVEIAFETLRGDLLALYDNVILRNLALANNRSPMDEESFRRHASCTSRQII